MRKFFQIAGAVSLVLVLAAAAVFGYAAYRGRGLDASSKAYVEENVPAVISTWSKDELLKRASPELLKALDESPERGERVFRLFSTLGAMRSFGGVKGEATMLYTPQQGEVITAYYVADARFENGDAHLAVRLIRRSEQWRFVLFNVNSPLFLR